MARRAVGAVARAHRRWRRLPAPPAPRTCRAAAGLALVLAVSFALPAHALDRTIANWWEDEKYIDPTSSDYKPMKSHDWAQGFTTGACEGGDGFELKIVTIKFQEPSTGDNDDRLELTLHRGGRIPFAKLATFRQNQSRIVKQLRQTQEKVGEYYHTVATYTPTSPVTLDPKTQYALKLVEPAVDEDKNGETDPGVSTAAVSLTASNDEARTQSNDAHWMGENKGKITDKALYRVRGGDTSTSEGWVKSDDNIRIFIGADSKPSCGYVDEDPPEPINTSEVVRAVPEDWPLVPTKLRVGDRFRLLFVTHGSRDATSTDIETYNSFVQSQCTSGGVEAIQDYCSDFRVVGGTSSVSARDNTYTNWRLRGRRGLPVYWMNSDALSADLIYATLGGPSFYNFSRPDTNPGAGGPKLPILIP